MTNPAPLCQKFIPSHATRCRRPLEEHCDALLNIRGASFDTHFQTCAKAHHRFESAPERSKAAL
jgi:hypothetical protein